MAVDFHSHILPGIDDGSQSLAQSLSMLQMSVEQGVEEIILTPHFYPERTSPERFLEKREQACRLLRENMGEGGPRLRCGAEVFFYPQMSHSDALRELAIEGTEHILVEMPLTRWTERMYRELEDIRRNLGLTPIVAHVERYLGRFRDYGIPRRLSELPVLVQANASFLLKGSRGLAMLRSRQIHLLGSDCHDLKDRKPNLGPALERIERKLGTDAIAWIASNEQEVLG